MRPPTVAIVNDRSVWSRAFGGGAANERAAAQRDAFDTLTEVADAHGVQWRDLVQDGYRVAGDRIVGGLTVSYDWVWRTEELRRWIVAQGGAEPADYA